jgi:hypothetical protein
VSGCCLSRLPRSGADLPQFEQFGAERFDLGEHSIYCRQIFKLARQYGVAAVHLKHHVGKGDRAGPEPILYPEPVQARRCGGQTGMLPDLVTKRRWNLVSARDVGDVYWRPVERSRSSRARLTAEERSRTRSFE